MPKILQLILIMTLLGLGACQNQSSASSSSVTIARQIPKINYQAIKLANATVHLVSIPPGNKITPVISPQLNTITEFARITKAKAVINAGFFDPNNYQTTSYIIKDGKVIGNPQKNQRLTENPNLQSYLPQILNRSEFRRYECRNRNGNSPNIKTIYDIKMRQEQPPNNCKLIDAIGAGPQLLPKYTAIAEAFVDPAKNRDAIGTTQPNARTAIGIKADGTVLWVMVTQNPTGMTLTQLREFMKNQGAIKALNLDGGSSSSLYFRGQSFYGKRDRNDNPIQRAIKSVLVVGK